MDLPAHLSVMSCVIGSQRLFSSSINLGLVSPAVRSTSKVFALSLCSPSQHETHAFNICTLILTVVGRPSSFLPWIVVAAGLFIEGFFWKPRLAKWKLRYQPFIYMVEKALYELPLAAEIVFGTFITSYAGGEGVMINSSVVAGEATKSVYIGTLRLSLSGTNFTDLSNSQPSILKPLDDGQISSRSWAYTASASYGKSRFIPNNLTIGLALDIS